MKSDKNLPPHRYDSPWKTIISEFFELFMRFFFPEIALEIDWDRPFESLDTELESLLKDQGTGKQIVDKLMKVYCFYGLGYSTNARFGQGFPNRAKRV